MKTLLLSKTWPNQGSNYKCDYGVLNLTKRRSSIQLQKNIINRFVQPNFIEDSMKIKPKLQKPKQLIINWLDTSNQLSIISSLYYYADHL